MYDVILLQLASHLPVTYLWVDVAYEWTLQSLIFQASPRPIAIPQKLLLLTCKRERKS